MVNKKGCVILPLQRAGGYRCSVKPASRGPLFSTVYGTYRTNTPALRQVTIHQLSTWTGRTRISWLDWHYALSMISYTFTLHMWDIMVDDHAITSVIVIISFFGSVFSRLMSSFAILINRSTCQAQRGEERRRERDGEENRLFFKCTSNNFSHIQLYQIKWISSSSTYTRLKLLGLGEGSKKRNRALSSWSRRFLIKYE